MDLSGFLVHFCIVLEYQSITGSSQTALPPGERSFRAAWQTGKGVLWSDKNVHSVPPHCLQHPLLQQWQNTLIYSYTVMTITLRSPVHCVFNHFSALFSLLSFLNQLYVKKFPARVFCLSVLGGHSGPLGSPYNFICLASHSSLFICFPILYFSQCSGKILIPEWRTV